jgi:hypothetical protein
MKWKLAGINEFTVSSDEIAILQIFKFTEFLPRSGARKARFSESTVGELDCFLKSLLHSPLFFFFYLFKITRMYFSFYNSLIGCSQTTKRFLALASWSKRRAAPASADRSFDSAR